MAKLFKIQAYIVNPNGEIKRKSHWWDMFSW